MFIESNRWPFLFHGRGWRNIITTDLKGPLIIKFAVKSNFNSPLPGSRGSVIWYRNYGVRTRLNAKALSSV